MWRAADQIDSAVMLSNIAGWKLWSSTFTTRASGCTGFGSGCLSSSTSLTVFPEVTIVHKLTLADADNARDAMLTRASYCEPGFRRLRIAFKQLNRFNVTQEALWLITCIRKLNRFEYIDLKWLSIASSPGHSQFLMLHARNGRAWDEKSRAQHRTTVKLMNVGRVQPQRILCKQYAISSSSLPA